MMGPPAHESDTKPPPGKTSLLLAGTVRELTVHADVLALLPDLATVRNCLDLAEEAAREIHGSMAAAHIGADPERMIAAPEEIDLQILRDMDENSPHQRFERIADAFEDWKRERPDRASLFLDDCRGDIERCVMTECHETALVVAPCHGNMDAQDTFYDLLFKKHKLLLVPPAGAYSGNLLGHVLIGWKPHKHALRTVVAARRWLAAADRVTVLCIDDKADGNYQRTASELLDQLGLKGDVVAVSAGGRPVGETILDFARSTGATCLLIGAFKRGYFMELLLGRITRHLLSHSTLPLMMKH
ncbi:universal stress protein (plasmid) [Rhizobium sp. CB3171]|uniref:universal stress protein n=1 Tax=Rhizobium sp. CB3171 TaxID=3039157 RepID=UPI0024B1E92D|nr:universal stress protein [Rhizobium sp. CB3171]WFU06085.1 universal stress protein [Rhizobium sp. CB3171]